MNNKQEIIEILDRKIKGYSASIKELEAIKEYVKNTTLRVGDGSVKLDSEIQQYFPFQWDEAQKEINQKMGIADDFSDAVDTEGEQLDTEDEK